MASSFAEQNLLKAAVEVVATFDQLPATSPTRMVPLNISSLRRAIALFEKDPDKKSDLLLESAFDLMTELNARHGDDDDDMTDEEAVEILAMYMPPMNIRRGGGRWRVDIPKAVVPYFGDTAQEAINSAIRGVFGSDVQAAALEKIKAEALSASDLCERLADLSE